ncbi:sirohydrochlorin cobaltochelatase [Clostridium fungisolvens]|uniref:Sirohydrochlorin cobaltochelatase n=1 Tax=Clostridium fungisolvens TaxID=1604897 RepID=A0A6V8SEN9_9CLOT|nr:sirohydrochlorin cobaltochelatase [Clostridium fungisolvens]GFP74945.1 Sirohydrochlorin cobaltochelatase [Clostridium fungisolvens]
MKKGLIVLSNGTADLEALDRYEQVIDNIDTSRYSEVIKAFASDKIIGKLKTRYNISKPNLRDGIEKLIKIGVEDITVATLFLIEGKEYEEAERLVKELREKYSNYSINITHAALIQQDKHRSYEFIDRISPIINREYEIILVAHGTSHQAQLSYYEFQKSLRDKGYENIHIGTIEGEPSFEDIVNQLKKRNIKRIVLQPFLFVVGFHGKKDLITDNPNSWKSRLIREGFEVFTSDKSLSEIQGVIDFIINSEYKKEYL